MVRSRLEAFTGSALLTHETAGSFWDQDDAQGGKQPHAGGVEQHERGQQQQRRGQIVAARDVSLLARLLSSPRCRGFGFVSVCVGHVWASN